MRALIGVTCPAQPDVEGAINYSYCRMVQEAGAVPLVFNLPSEAEQVNPVLDAIDALIITSEACDSPIDEELAKQFLLAALQKDIPLLAVDAGCLLLNRILGGSCCEHSSSDTRHQQGNLPGNLPSHSLRLDPWSCLATFFGETRLEVNSFHQVSVSKVGDGLMPVAWSDDGTIEAVESRAHTFVVGVQFRPHLMSDYGQRIFMAFRRSAETHRQRKRLSRQAESQLAD